MVRLKSSIGSSEAPSTPISTKTPHPKAFTDGLPLPKLIVFDLDYTLWPFWVDTHVTPPIKALEGGRSVKDRYGEGFQFYDDVGGILSSLRHLQVKVGAASRTDAPDLAREMLKLLKVPAHSPLHPDHPPAKAPTHARAIEFFDHLQIFPGSKTRHFEKMQEITGLPYEEMLFFDDESRNRDVERLGVVMWLVRDGLTNEEVDNGIHSWRKRNRRLQN